MTQDERTPLIDWPKVYRLMDEASAADAETDRLYEIARTRNDEGDWKRCDDARDSARRLWDTAFAEMSWSRNYPTSD